MKTLSGSSIVQASCPPGFSGRAPQRCHAIVVESTQATRTTTSLTRGPRTISIAAIDDSPIAGLTRIAQRRRRPIRMLLTPAESDRAWVTQYIAPTAPGNTASYRDRATTPTHTLLKQDTQT